ncbi:MAG TPA: WGR domain-containing protein, partial [Terriglobales bacterium]|nr:WGR domain-containing protein [Terriglobales bacterium]
MSAFSIGCPDGGVRGVLVQSRRDQQVAKRLLRKLRRVDLVRRWGRTGTVGSSLIQAFPDEPSAQAALDTLAERKRRRGYT